MVQLFWLFCVCFSHPLKVQEFWEFVVTTSILHNFCSREIVSANGDVRVRVHVNAAVKVKLVANECETVNAHVNVQGECKCMCE